MHSWRDSTFEALRRAASFASTRWPDYATYATQQEQGLRKDALAAARRVAASFASARVEERWAFVRWILEDVVIGGVVLESLLPHPLKVAIVLPTLREQRSAPTETADALLLMLRHYKPELYLEALDAKEDPIDALLRRSIPRFPSDGRVKRALSLHLLGIVEENGHHLSESLYLGEVEPDLARLAEAHALVSDDDPLRAEVEQMRALVEAWKAFRGANLEPGTDFAAWCRAHGVALPSRTVVYYDR